MSMTMVPILEQLARTVGRRELISWTRVPG